MLDAPRHAKERNDFLGRPLTPTSMRPQCRSTVAADGAGPRRLAAWPVFAGTCVVLLVLSCAGMDPNVRRGDELAEEGRWHEAMLEYEEAAERSPRSSSIRERLEDARLRVAHDLAEAAEGSMEVRRFERAERFLEQALELAPDSPRVVEARRNIATAWAEEARALLEEDEDLERAFLVADRAAEIDRDAPSVRTVRNRVRSEYAEWLRDEAEAYDQEGRLAPALVALVKLQEIDRLDGESRDRMSAMRSLLHDQAAYHVRVDRVRAGRGLRGSANDLRERLLGLHPPSGCPNMRISREATEGPGAVIAGELAEHEFETSERLRSETHTYQSGTRDVPNPEHPERARDVELAEEEMNEILEEIQRLIEEVRRREVAVVEVGPEDDVASRRRDLERARDQLSEAREEARRIGEHLAELQEIFNATPETLEEPVMTDEVLEITQAERSFRIELLFEARDLETNDTIWRRRLFAAETGTEAEHHDGLAPAGIEPIPLELPKSDHELRDEAIDEIFAELRDDLGDLCRRHREELRQRGLSLASVDDKAGATEWFVLGLFYDPLGDLEDWDVDGRVERFFRRTWRIDDPFAIIGP